MSTNPKIAIILIHYNTPHFIKSCLDHIFNQTYKNIDVYLVDNNSSDKSIFDFAKSNYQKTAEERGNKFVIVQNLENLGYAKAANQGIKLALENSSAYIVITNPDIIYSPTYFEKTVHRIEKNNTEKHNTVTSSTAKNNKIAGITGKVYKYDFAQNKPTKIIDTIGLYISKGLRVVDGGQGTLDEGQFNEEREIFGISGACPLYSAQALQDACIDGEYFDEDFFMYKEDVDLSWRLQLFGYKFLYYPQAIAFHGRGTSAVERKTSLQIFKNRNKLTRFQKHYSYRNHNLMILKNLLWGRYMKNFFQIIGRDMGTFFYLIFFEPFLLKSVYEYFKLVPKMLKKRKQIMRKMRTNRTSNTNLPQISVKTQN
jgi:GT2 family glycosyltransferase